MKESILNLIRSCGIGILVAQDSS